MLMAQNAIMLDKYHSYEFDLAECFMLLFLVIRKEENVGDYLHFVLPG